MKYIIIICFFLLSISCAAQLESASPNLIVKHGIDVDTVTVLNPTYRGLHLPIDTAWYYRRDTVSVIILYIDTILDKSIHWMNGYEIKSMCCEREYLDENKQPLSKSIVIWAVK